MSKNIVFTAHYVWEQVIKDIDCSSLLLKDLFRLPLTNEAKIS